MNNGHNLWFSVEIGPDGKVTGTGIYVHVHVNCVSNKAMLATILYILLYMPVLPEDFTVCTHMQALVSWLKFTQWVYW